MDIKELLKEGKGTIIDVRTPEEFQMGQAVGSINIPLQEVVDRLEEIKQKPTPLILCCASGNRSGQVANYLTQQNIECVNAGSWLDINFLQSQLNN